MTACARGAITFPSLPLLLYDRDAMVVVGVFHFLVFISSHSSGGAAPSPLSSGASNRRHKWRRSRSFAVIVQQIRLKWRQLEKLAIHLILPARIHRAIHPSLQASHHERWPCQCVRVSAQSHHPNGRTTPHPIMLVGQWSERERRRRVSAVPRWPPIDGFADPADDRVTGRANERADGREKSEIA